MYNILVVDDEEIIREGLISKLKKGGFAWSRIEEAASAEQGLKRMEELRPHIVLCDIRMEEMDGLEMIRTLSRKYPRTKMIIISGYSEFEYASRALKLGVVDYLLKPIDKSTLYQALARCFEMIEKEEQEQRSLEQWSMQESARELRSKLARIEFEDCDPAEIFRAGRPDSLFQAAYLLADPQARAWDADMLGEALTRDGEWSYGDNLALFEASPSEFALFFCLAEPSGREPFAEAVDRALARLQDELLRRNHFQFTIGTSGMHERLADSYREAVHCMKHRLFIEDNHRIAPMDAEPYKQLYKIPLHKFMTLKHYTESNDLRSVVAVLNEMRTEVSEALPAYHCAQNLYNHFLTTALEDFNIDPSVHFQPFRQEVYYFHSLRDMFDWLQELFTTIINISNSSRHSKEKVIQSLKAYIDTHYAEDVKLEDIAEIQHYNASYLSIVFKEVMNINFQDYLLKVRMDNAQSMLLSGKHKVKDIARMTGFKNPHYFSTVFKKAKGVTPKEFVKAFHS
ncbi:response regulator [Cohnella cellulosilytica]|uniref:Response regulator n=1 Tax=Cohnella cellulosilytica TaxID=986710 RepID=A0ABW2FEX2_9BACL